MKARAQKLAIVGEIAHRHEADPLLTSAGSAALVRRGVARSLVISCPDGCGEMLTINLDPRAGPAWRMYHNSRGVSLFPSVWRDTGCRSHFIVWQSRIYWCDWGEDLEPTEKSLEDRVHAALLATLTPYLDIADALNEIPWAVLSACNHLTRRGLAIAGVGRENGMFRLRPSGG